MQMAVPKASATSHSATGLCILPGPALVTNICLHRGSLWALCSRVYGLSYSFSLQIEPKLYITWQI